jgi:hypothetical protein
MAGARGGRLLVSAFGATFLAFGAGALAGAASAAQDEGLTGKTASLGLVGLLFALVGVSLTQGRLRRMGESTTSVVPTGFGALSRSVSRSRGPLVKRPLAIGPRSACRQRCGGEGRELDVVPIPQRLSP